MLIIFYIFVNFYDLNVNSNPLPLLLSGIGLTLLISTTIFKMIGEVTCLWIGEIDFQNLCMEDMVQISFLSFCLGLQLRCVLFRFLFQEDLVPFLVLWFCFLFFILILECFHVIFISVLLKTRSICVFSVAGATRLPMRRTLPVSASIIISTSVRDVARGFVFLKDTVRFRFVALSATPLL